MSYRIKFLEIIESIIYLNLATVDKLGNPHNAPVYTAYDESYNFYWKSWTENQHSKNIEENGKCFVTLYDSTTPAGTGIGVYMFGVAKKVTESFEKERAHKLYTQRGGDVVEESIEHQFAYPREFYKFIPEKVWINGSDTKEKNFVDIRIDITDEILQTK